MKFDSKLCECVNIWDLFISNGLTIKFQSKYLLFKRFFIKRSISKQNKSDDNKHDMDLMDESFKTKIMKCLGLGPKDEEMLNLPRGIVKGDGTFRNLMHFIMFFLLIYTFLTIPVIYIIGINYPVLSALEKIVAAFFFFDMVFRFRTSVKDKANNWVYDIDIIGNRYLYSIVILDAIASIPFNLLFSSGSISLNSNLRFFRSFVKVLRIGQIFPAIEMVERRRGFSSIVRLTKLIFTYLLIAHWLASFMFSTINTGLIYSSMERVCYTSTLLRSKQALKSECKWTFSIYNASFLLIGQYTNWFHIYQTLNPTMEYLICILGYLLGQFMVAFVFGGVSAIILNLNQAANFFSKKVEMLNDHMSFYGVTYETQNDVRTFYNYLWQRHKDIIYSKYHFDLLTESLREKFEKLNLPTNEAYLGKFYKLNIGNTKMIGQILMFLKKKILYPYEILFEERSVTKGLYILLNGEIQLCNLQIPNMSSESMFIEYTSVIKEIDKLHEDKRNHEPNIVELWDRQDLSIVFPLISCLIKTGRNYQRCYSKDFADLLFLPVESFDKIVFNFPVEMHILKHNVMEYIEQKKLFDNEILFKMLSTHSSRSVGSLYEKEYNKHNLWIPIPIPISQRKIAKNYFQSFIKKVKNQYREIVVSGDINITLNGFIISSILKKDEQKSSKDSNGLFDIDGKSDKKIKNTDPIEDIKEKTKKIVKLVEVVMKKGRESRGIVL